MGGRKMFNLAIMGLGAWGKNLIGSVQGKSDSVRFVSAVTRTPAKVEDFTRQHGIGLGSDYGAMLSDDAIDGVVICGPGDLHVEHAAAAIDAGKHVLVIKPLALRRTEAVELYEAAGKKGVFLGMGYERCFLPAIDELRRRVAAGDLGQIVHAEGDYCVGRYSNMTREHWKTNSAVAPAGALAFHMLYLMIELIGPVEELQARGLHLATDLDAPDTSTVTLRFAGGASGLLTAIGVTANYARVVFFGTEGWAEVRGASRFEFTPSIGEPTVIDFPEFDSLRSQLECFAVAAMDEAAFPVSPENAIAGVAAVEAMGQSVKSGGPIAL